MPGRASSSRPGSLRHPCRTLLPRAMTAELTRRDFLTHAGRLVIFLPVGASLIAACGSSPNADCASADTVMDTGAALIVTSTCAGAGAGHDHDFTVQHTDLATPAAGGVARSVCCTVKSPRRRPPASPA